MTKKSTAFTDVFLMPFGLVFVLAGLGAGILYYMQLRDWFRARDWVEVPCVIESVNLREESRRSSKSDSTYLVHEAEAAYRYEFSGRAYTGTKVSLSSGADNMGDYQSRVAGLLAGYAESREPFRCYVNPAQPEESLLFREARWPMLLLTSLFPVIFPTMGGAVFFSGCLGFLRRRKQRRQNGLFLKEAWRGTSAGSEGWIQARNRGALLPWLLATVWLGVVWLPMLYVVAADSDAGWDRPLSWLAWLPVLPLVFLFISTLRRLRQKWMGWPQLHVSPRPAQPGERLGIYLGLPPHFPAGLHEQVTVIVRCVKQTAKRSGKSVSIQRETLWSAEHDVSLMQATREGGGRRLPLEFQLPADQPAPAADAYETFSTVPFAWELELRHPKLVVMPVFELPVFQKDGMAMDPASARPQAAPVKSLRAEREAARHAPPMAAGDIVSNLAKTGLKAELNSQGLPVCLESGKGAFRGVRTFLTVFTLVWSAVVIVIFNSDAPPLFGLVFGGVAAVLWWVMVLQWRHKRLMFSAEGVDIRWRLGPLGGHQKYEKRHLIRFFSRMNVKSGTNTYYQVCAETTFGKHVALVDGLSGTQAADEVCGLLERWRKEA